jgi:hypothetical protein
VQLGKGFKELDSEIDFDVGIGVGVHGSGQPFKTLARESSKEGEEDFVVW